MKLLCYRPHPSPTRPLPLNVRSAGNYLLEPGEQEIRNPGNFLQIFWTIQGSGEIRLPSRKIICRPGTVLFYQPGEHHHLTALHEGFGYRWMTLDGNGASSIPKEFRLHRPQSAGPCPEHLFEALDPCLRDATLLGEQRSSLLAYEILVAACTGRPVPHPANLQDHAVQQAKSWIESHFTDPHLNISSLAGKFHIHRSTLYRLFYQRHGVSPVRYLNRLRIRKALEILKDGTLPVADAAVQSGIPDIAYFSRQIKRQTGYSPRAYRQRYAA